LKQQFTQLSGAQSSSDEAVGELRRKVFPRTKFPFTSEPLGGLIVPLKVFAKNEMEPNCVGLGGASVLNFWLRCISTGQEWTPDGMEHSIRALQSSSINSLGRGKDDGIVSWEMVGEIQISSVICLKLCFSR
jgi:hypothetical protein